MGYKPISDEQYEAGRVVGQERLSRAVRAVSVRYDPNDDFITIRLSDMTSVGVKHTAIAEWAALSTDDMRDIRLSAMRDAIAVGPHDVQVSVEGLLRTIMPENFIYRTFAYHGGSATSFAKAKAARANGARGGRPKKVPVVMSR